MEQRRLRLGDIVDDYCPRERRITNHAVVAMIEDQIKQTRCATCDADHPYKGGKAPAPRRKKETGVLYGGAPDGSKPRVLVAHAPDADTDPEHDAAPAAFDSDPIEQSAAAAPDDHDVEIAPAPDVDEPAADPDAERSGVEDEWPVHRRLIRATLPRVEGQQPERKEPDFTMRRPVGRGADGNRNNGQRPQRTGPHHPMRQAHGQGPSGGQHSRFGGPRQGGGGQGQQRQGSGHGGQQPGNRPARNGGQHRGPQSGGGRKRGR